MIGKFVLLRGRPWMVLSRTTRAGRVTLKCTCYASVYRYTQQVSERFRFTVVPKDKALTFWDRASVSPNRRSLRMDPRTFRVSGGGTSS